MTNWGNSTYANVAKDDIRPQIKEALRSYYKKSVLMAATPNYRLFLQPGTLNRLSVKT